MDKHTDVIVVGAGPAGLSAACAARWRAAAASASLRCAVSRPSASSSPVSAEDMNTSATVSAMSTTA